MIFKPGDIVGYTVQIRSGEETKHKFHKCYHNMGEYYLHYPLPFYFYDFETFIMWRIKSIKEQAIPNTLIIKTTDNITFDNKKT